MINRIRLIHGDLTRQSDVDAIVTAIPVSLEVRGSLNTAIMNAAGAQLDEFILEHVYKPQPGDVVAVPPFNLAVGHILFAFLPDWKTEFDREDRDLIRCYRQAIEQAERMGLSSLAFAAIGMGEGKFAWPLQRAVRLTVQSLLDRMSGPLQDVRIVCNRSEVVRAFEDRLRQQGWRGHVEEQGL